MAKIQVDKFGKDKGPSLRGVGQMYTRNGGIVFAAWPRKRGKPKTPGHKDRVDFFTKANQLAKYACAEQQNLLRAASAGTPFMPRDWQVSFMAGRAVQVDFPASGSIRSYRAMIQTSFALDQLPNGTTPGYTLQRGAQNWEAVPWPGGGGGGTANWWFSPPLAADMTAFSGDATLPTMTDDADAGLILHSGAPVAGDVLRIVGKQLTTPTNDWSLFVAYRFLKPTQNYSGVGVALYDSAGGRAMWFGVPNGYLLEVDRFNGLAGYNSRVAHVSGTVQNVGLVFMKIEQVANTVYWYFGPDGKSWQLLYSATATTWLAIAADTLGVGVTYNRTTGPENMVTVEAFSLTGPAV